MHSKLRLQAQYLALATCTGIDLGIDESEPIPIDPGYVPNHPVIDNGAPARGVPMRGHKGRSAYSPPAQLTNRAARRARAAHNRKPRP